MIDALPLLLGPEGYQISRSVRLRSSASAFFNRTYGTATNTLIWTFSAWVKRGQLGGNGPYLLEGYSNATNRAAITFTSGDALTFFYQSGGTVVSQLTTTQVFRDPSAWYHILVAYDATQATASNRLKFYVNGVQVTAFSTATYPSLNQASWIDTSSAPHYLGKTNAAAGYEFDGYLTEINFIDGQALTPSSFGETNPITGVWQPKKYAGTYGTNGFYLNFSDNSAATAAAIGKDYSGNGNNWTPNNISVTSGTTYDSMLDVPTQWADGGNGRGNYATLNPLIPIPRGTISAANLQYASGSTSSHGSVAATITMPTTGKWYWEVTACNNSGGSGNNEAIGIANIQNNPQLPAALSEVGSRSGDYAYRSNGVRVSGGSSVSYGATYTNGDVIGVAWDSDNGTLTFYKNGVSQGTAYSSITQVEGRFAPASSNAETAGSDVYNFGQRPFAYTPPSGFKALNTLNLPTPTILKGNQYFDATTYTGTSASNAVVNASGFQPDLVWLKNRNYATGTNHVLVDSVRGASLGLASNLTNAEFSTAGNFSSINSNGFTVAGTTRDYNFLNDTFVAWQWKEGATQGFDIVTGTAPASGAFTVNHSLGVAPAMIILKDRSNSSTNWGVYHKNMNASPQAYFMQLNTTIAATNNTSVWNNSAPTSTSFQSTANSIVNPSANYVAYLFAEVAGFSKFGTWQNNNSTDGTFIYLGFRPRFILLKNYDNVEGWFIWDSARQTYNMAPPSNNWLNPNLSNAEGANNASTAEIDGLSNGFKIRTTNPATGEVSFGTRNYIYAAFAESPFKNSLAR